MLELDTVRTCSSHNFPSIPRHIARWPPNPNSPPIPQKFWAAQDSVYSGRTALSAGLAWLEMALAKNGTCLFTLFSFSLTREAQFLNLR